MPILKFLWGLVTGSAGGAVGGAVSTVSQFALFLSALVPLGLWLTKSKDEVFITLTYGDLVFWGAICLIQLSVIRLAHRAPPP